MSAESEKKEREFREYFMGGFFDQIGVRFSIDQLPKDVTPVYDGEGWTLNIVEGMPKWQRGGIEENKKRRTVTTALYPESLLFQRGGPFWQAMTKLPVVLSEIDRVILPRGEENKTGVLILLKG